MSDKLYPVGKVSRLFGNEGELTINLYDTFPQEVRYEEPVYVVIDSLPVPLFFDSFRRKGRAGAVVMFADIDTPARAEQLLGLEVMAMVCEKGEVEQESPDELYMEDLTGFGAVINSGGVVLPGECVITDFFDNDLNPLFEVTCGGKQLLIPAVDEFFEEIDAEGRKVVFTLPEGLVDLNR